MSYSIEDLFTNPGAGKANHQNDKVVVQNIPINKIEKSPYNPIGLYDEEKQYELTESIKMTGVRTPILVRPVDNGYELIDGHNRVNCAKLAGLEVIPAIVKSFTDEDAKLINADAIVQQRGFSDLKPSVKAEIIHRLEEDIKKEKLSPEIRSKMTEDQNSIDNQIDREIGRASKFRYLRLYRCSNKLKQHVDEKLISLMVAIELADINNQLQDEIVEALNENKIKLDLKKAKLLKEKDAKGELNTESIYALLLGKKKRSPKNLNVKLPIEFKTVYFQDKNNDEILNIIQKALDLYFKNNDESHRETND